MPHYFEIFVENPALIKTTAGYEQIKVYRSTTFDGTYTVLPTVLTLSASQSLYPYLDGTGDPSYWYKYTFFDTDAPTAESSAIGPYPGGTLMYCRVADLKSRLNDGTNNLAADDQIFYQCVRAATDHVRRHCRRHFEWRQETRYFDGPSFKGEFDGKGPQTLYLDDLVSVSLLQLDFSGGRQGASLSTLVTGTDVYMWPQDASTMEEPYQALAFVPGANPVLAGLVTSQYYEGYTTGLKWPRGYRAVRVTGIWGWPIQSLTGSSIPADIQEATLEISARLYKGKDNAYSRVTGNAQLGTTYVMDALLNKDTLALLAPYRRLLSY